jgi:hypothetical protein
MKYVEEKEKVFRKKKPKDFLIEYKWIDKKYWDAAMKWFKNEEYNPDFQKDIFDEKFETLEAAKESIKNRLNKAYNSTYLPLKDNMYKIFRVKNIKTGEIYEYD